ncbi:MAG: hypothetical protein HY319_30805 [Armatimonadetes bacterium]|nr:hypothetical protein [Armatimonadota bacterium]
MNRGASATVSAVMDESQFLEKIQQLRKRLLRLRSIQAAAAWSLPGALVALALILLLKILGRPLSDLMLPLWALALFPAGGAAVAALRPLSLQRAALHTDGALELKERLTTAVEWILEERPRTVLAQSLLQDAAARAVQIDAAEAFPLSLPRRTLGRAALILAVACTLLVLPPWNLFGQEEAQELQIVRQASDDLMDLAQQLPLRHADSPDAQRLKAELEELARQLREPGVDEQEAAARISEYGENLRRQSESAAGGEKGGSAAEEGQGTGVQEQLQQLTRQLAQPGVPSQGREGLDELAQRLPPGSAERQALERAAQALEKGDFQEAREACGEAARHMGDSGGSPSELEGEVLAELEAQQQLLEASSEKNASPGEGEGALMNPDPEVTPGSSQATAPADFGVGTTDEEESGVPGQPDRHDFVRDSDRTSDWSEEYQRLYGSERHHFDTAPSHVRGQLTAGGELLPAAGEVVGAPRPGGSVRLAPGEVFLESKRQAEQAVSRDTIPAEYRETVRSYFDGIDPRVRPQ